MGSSGNSSVNTSNIANTINSSLIKKKKKSKTKGNCRCVKDKKKQLICGNSCVNKGKECSSVKKCNKKKSLKGGMVFDYNDMTTEAARNKAKEIGKMYGKPDRIERLQNNNIFKVTWLNIEGHDEVIVYNDIYRKFHPHKAVVYVETKKLLKVPEHLLGPLKYASETINIEQIHTDKKENKKYGNTGIKGRSMVSGSCASITISAITVKFVEDMCKKHKKSNPTISLHKEFRKEYDNRVDNYLRGNGIVPKIPWYPNKLEKSLANKKFI